MSDAIHHLENTCSELKGSESAVAAANKGEGAAGEAVPDAEVSIWLLPWVAADAGDEKQNMAAVSDGTFIDQ